MRSFVEFKRALFAGLLFLGLGIPLNQQIFLPSGGNKRSLAQAAPVEPTQVGNLAHSPESGAVFHFRCADNSSPEQLETTSTYIRVLGENCDLQKESFDLSVKHVGDQTKAQILWLEEKKFSTDLIRLKKGENIVEVAYLENGERKSHRLQVINNSKTDRQE